MSEQIETDVLISNDIQEHGKLPEPTLDSPLAQVKWIFDRIISIKTKTSTRRNYITGRNFFLKHLQAIGFNAPYYLKQEWDAWALLRFRQELDRRVQDEEIKYTTYTLVGLFSAIRFVMRYAAMHGLAACNAMHEVCYEGGSAETNTNTAYPDGELTQILDAIGCELETSRRILNGYVAQANGLGRDPRITVRGGKEKGFGFKVEANMRWYFENVLNCVPVEYDEEGKRLHNTFLNNATNVHGGLTELYRSWGVSKYFDLDMLMPHIINLAYLTGLNPGPLAALMVDSYGESHPATGKPYLRYVKDKVSKELELYLELLDKSGESSTFDDSVLHKTTERFLPPQQARQIAKTIEILRRATEPLRNRLPFGHPLKHRLCIYVSRGRRTFGQIRGISSEETSRWCAQLVERYGLIGEDGNSLRFNLTRFRSTRLTELALQGRDLLEIKLIASHKNIRTTINYLARKKLEVEARKVVRDALTTIHSNRHEFDDPEICTGSRTKGSTEQPVHLYRGLLSDCKNPFDPPKRVRASKSYVPGHSCSKFNMCIFCKNVVIFRRNLPMLVAYLDQINAAMDANVHSLPNAGFYEDTKAVIENLLDPEQSEFSEEDILWAKQEAANLNPLLDNAVYRGVVGA